MRYNRLGVVDLLVLFVLYGVAIGCVMGWI